MASLHIGTLEVHHRDGRATARFEPVLRRLVDEGLSRALDDVGLEHGECVCIRELDVPVRLAGSASDVALVEQWSRAIAAAIRQAADGAPAGPRAAGESRSGSAEVVRWRSPRQARLDLLLSFAKGDLARAWAWRRLGLLPPGEGAPHPDEVARALAAEPDRVVAFLVEAARAGLFVRLTRLFARDALLFLSEAALGVHRLPRSLLSSAAAIDPVHGAQASDRRDAADLVRRSVLAQAAQAGRLILADAKAAAALAALCVLETEPSRLASPDAPEVLAVVAFRLDARYGSGSEADRAGREEDGSVAAVSGNRTETPAVPDARPIEEDSRRTIASTTRGGLLYLLHLVAAEGLPERLRDDPRGLRWWLHRLGMRLATAPEGDPAVLAFAGFPPDAEPPAPPSATPAESETIESVARGLEERLASLTASDPVGLVELTDRRADLLWDPGWLEVRFPASAVDTRVRRAGLDRDPDFVAWLGCVVRFSYV